MRGGVIVAAREPPFQNAASGQKNTSIPTCHLAVRRNRSMQVPPKRVILYLYFITQGTALTRGKCQNEQK